MLCIHQGAELYGSDRSFAQALAALRAQFPQAHITVVLAADGPLVPMLRAHCDEIVIRDLLVLRLANPLITLLKCTIGLPWYLARAWAEGLRADLVYVNTSVIADFMIAARLAPRRYIMHVREIPKPAALPVVRGFCRFSRARILFNSQATRDAYALPADQPQAVIHNGVDPVPGSAPCHPPAAFTRERPLRLALLGRINNWKGQDLLVEAVARLSPEERALLHVRIVGGVFGQATAPRDALMQAIANHVLGDTVSVEPFQDDPSEVFAWADMIAVPSRLPEPFGRVAIEAMAAGRGVLAAEHGGLVEIVRHQHSGWLFPPNDAEKLLEALRWLIAHPQTLADYGAGALEDFHRAFSTEAMSGALRKKIVRWMDW